MTTKLHGSGLQLGDDATPTRNFVWTAASADGTVKLHRGNLGAGTQDILTVSAAGIPNFAQLARTFGASGSVMLEGGLIVKWGSATSGGATNTITYPTQFPTATVFALCIHTTASTYVWPVTGKAAATFNNICYNLSGTPTSGIAYDWLAIGY